MAMILAAVSGDFADTSFFTRLEIDGLARLESACRGMRELIQEGGAWGSCISHSLPDVSIQGEVRAAADQGATRERRLEIKKLLSTLASVHTLVPGREPLTIATLERIKELQAAVTRGLDQASAHAEAGGSASRVVVGHFYFPNAMAIPAAVVNTAGEDLDGDLGSLWSVSAPLHFSLPRSPNKNKRRSRRRGTNQNAEEKLCLRLAWRGDSVLARITKRGASVVSPVPFPGADFGRELMLDVRALGNAPILRSRGTLMRVGGPWKKVSGVCAAHLPRVELAEALSTGLACVVCVRDTLDLRAAAEHSDCVLSMSSQCANALNLEVSARHRPSDMISMLSFLPEFEVAAVRPGGTIMAAAVAEPDVDGSFLEMEAPEMWEPWDPSD
jgi:hypothetical protein